MSQTSAPPPGGRPPRPRAPHRSTAAERQAQARRAAARSFAANAEARRAAGRNPLRNVGPSLAKASGSIAIATLVSRVTGFLTKIMLASLLSIGLVNDAYNLADTLPNKITELLLAGVLTSVVVPVLVRAQLEDRDNGLAYAQRLMSMTVVWMGAGAVLGTIAAPLLTHIYVSAGKPELVGLVTFFGYLLLPQIFFYALSALISAILNANNVFKPTAWAPVLNNAVVLLTGLIYLLVPGSLAHPSTAKLLVLGIGTTLGIVAQTVVMVPALRRSGFRWQWRWGIDDRLKAFGQMALWVLGYVAISQVGLLVVDRLSTAAAKGTVTSYQYSWLLVQMPYGVIGFSLLTAIMPRMSRKAASGDHDGLVDDLSLANRLSTVMLGPISGLMTILGPQIGLALFSYGESDAAKATRLGLTLTVSAFGLLPYAITLVQSRVFYAMADAKTPTLIMGVMVVVKIPLSYLCPVLLNPEHVVYGLAFVNSLSFVIGALAGQYWLRRRIGRLGNARVLLTIGKTLIASVWGAAATLIVIKLLHAVGPDARVALAWPALILGALVGGAVTVGAMTLLRVDELKPALSRITRAMNRR
ncbi:MAG: murein biosynthesis integral membrane protein MurJ [Sciscionella sp.]